MYTSSECNGSKAVSIPFKSDSFSLPVPSLLSPPSFLRRRTAPRPIATTARDNKYSRQRAPRPAEEEKTPTPRRHSRAATPPTALLSSTPTRDRRTMTTTTTKLRWVPGFYAAPRLTTPRPRLCRRDPPLRRLHHHDPPPRRNPRGPLLRAPAGHPRGSGRTGL